jgi:hypothetical protein
MPKTTLFFELDAANYDYAEDNPTPAVETLDSSETRYYLGVKWEATAQTTGTAKIGQYSKDFDDDVIDDIDGEFAWDIKLDWTPTENDKITARTGSYIRETEGSGAAIETQDIYLSWVHFWLERLSTKASYRTADDDHGQFSPTFRREDTTDTLEISATYNFKRWMDVSLRYNTESRSSNGEAFEYDRDIIALDFDFSL